MMKETLIVLAHPHFEQSTVNKRWIDELTDYQEYITVHSLYEKYPNEMINIKSEQALVEQHKHLILQFPIYWFNCPPLLKKWLDEVFTYGWAYGRQGNKLKNKKIALAVSAGIQEHDYVEKGRYKYPLQEILRPFELTIDYVGADYQPLFAFYGATNEPNSEYGITSEQVTQSAKDYIHWTRLLKMLPVDA